MADRDVTVRLRADIGQYQRELAAASAATTAFGRNTSRAGSEIDKFSGRLRLMTDLATIGAPAMTAFGAAGVGAMAAMAGQAVALGGALGVTLLAINGVGDALKALDAYQLNPTTANLLKMRAAMDKIGPSGQNFVRFLDEIEPQLKSLQDVARDGLLPGAENGIAALLKDLPRVRDLVGEVAQELGRQSESAGKSLAGEDFENFLHYLETDGVPILHNTAHTIGNLAIAGANLTAAFSGTQRDFSGGLLKFSENLANASKHLDTNKGFQEFLQYIDEVGPKAVAALEAVANAALQIVEATAPLGGPSLTILTAVANVIASIADSDLGTPIFAGIAALAIYNRTLAVTAKLQQSLALSSPWTAAVVIGAAAVAEFASANDDLSSSLQSIDTAKASGNIDTYAASIDAAQKSLDDFRAKQTENDGAAVNALPFGLGGLTQLDNLSSWYHEFNGDNEEAQKKIDAARASLKSFADGSVVSPVNAISNAINDSAQAAQHEADALAAATNAMREARSEALKSADAHLAYKSAILDAQDALKKNGKTLDLNTRAGIDNKSKLDALAAAWNAQSDAAKNASGALGRARQNFINTAEAMGMSADKAHQLANRLFEIKPRDVKVTVEGLDPAIGKAQTLAAVLASLHSKDLTVAVHYQTFGNKLAAGQVPLPGVQPKADGGLIRGPGGPRDDMIPARLSNNEYVVSAAAVGKYGVAMFDAINARRFADGGSAGGRGPQTSFTLNPALPSASSPFGVFVAGAYSAATALRGLKAALDKAEKSLDKERQTRDDLQSRYDDIKSAVGSAYSTLDPFAKPQATGGSVFAAGAGMPNALSVFDQAIAGNTANTQAAQSALAAAAAHGLDGPLYEALARSGNLQLLQAFAGLSSEQINQRELAFAAQSNAQNALGGAAADQLGVTQQLADANKNLDKIQREVRELRHDVKEADKNNQKAQDKNAKDVKDGVNGAASNGHRRGHH